MTCKKFNLFDEYAARYLHPFRQQEECTLVTVDIIFKNKLQFLSFFIFLIYET